MTVRQVIVKLEERTRFSGTRMEEIIRQAAAAWLARERSAPRR